MCGIVGKLVLDSGNVELSELKGMSDSIIHRGPDGEGHWINEKKTVGFGHRRLAIIDLSEGGHQPMHYGDERYSITFNGEIYNYLELKELLIKKGYQFRTASDTEVLLAMYDHKGKECLEYLDGMFAFAIWDSKKEILFCARDRFGEKPFFYAINDGSFVFASEMKALWAYSDRLRTPDSTMVFNYLNNNYFLNPEDLSATFYKHIRRLPAAHFLEIRNGNMTIKRYWSIDPKSNIEISEKEASDKFYELFQRSVSRRLRSDVPVGTSLSGGLDSSLVVCSMNELIKPKRVNTFSARFKNFSKDEGYFMDIVNKKVNAIPHAVYPEGNDMINKLEKIYYHQEEPSGSASVLIQYEVFNLAKENGVTVLLDGQGADEILAGYHYFFPTFFNELKTQDTYLYKEQYTAYKELFNLPDDNTNRGVPAVSEKSLNRKLKDIVKKYVSKDNIDSIRMKVNRIKGPAALNMNRDFYHTNLANQFKNISYDQNSLNDHLYSQTTHYGLYTLLRHADRNSMAHSREVRLPFLEKDLVEFIFSLPSKYKIHNGWTKYVLRKASEDLMPKEITWRKDKIGYEPPQKKWMSSDDFKEYVLESRKVLVENGILDKNIIKKGVEAVDYNVRGDSSWHHIMIAKLFESKSA